MTKALVDVPLFAVLPSGRTVMAAELRDHILSLRSEADRLGAELATTRRELNAAVLAWHEAGATFSGIAGRLGVSRTRAQQIVTSGRRGRGDAR